MSDLVWAIKNGDLGESDQMLTCKQGKFTRVDILLKIDSPLCNSADRVRELSSASGFDVNAAVDGRSPLHFAADYGQLEVIEFLVGKVNFTPNINVYCTVQLQM